MLNSSEAFCQVCIEITPDGPVEVLDNCTDDGREDANNDTTPGDDFQETPISALTVLIRDEEEREEERLEKGEGSRGEGYHEGGGYHDEEHPHHHTHLDENGFFCNPVGECHHL